MLQIRLSLKVKNAYNLSSKKHDGSNNRIISSESRLRRVSIFSGFILTH